ncbi:MAG: hypothetical protein L3J56_04410 [Bacteroidales bacterium]|nr:hypothetical protein [Bacteroidales bacterium]
MVTKIRTNIEIPFNEIGKKFKVVNNFDGKILFFDKKDAFVGYSITKEKNKIFAAKSIIDKNSNLESIELMKIISPKEINFVTIDVFES